MRRSRMRICRSLLQLLTRFEQSNRGCFLGTIVKREIERYSIVGGNPMHVIRTDAVPDVVHRARLSL